MNMRWSAFRAGVVGLTFCILASARPSAAGEGKGRPGNREEWQQPDRVMTDLDMKSGATVADIGCGSGYFTFRLAGAVGKNGKVFAADIDRKALKSIAGRIEKERRENIETVLSDPTDTKLDPGCVDVALICDVLHHVPQEQRAALARNVAQAIKPGGFLCLIDWRKSKDVPFDSYDRKISQDDLVKLFTDAGLPLDAEFHYLKYQVFLRFRKPPETDRSERKPKEPARN